MDETRGGGVVEVLFIMVALEGRKSDAKNAEEWRKVTTPFY
jgi:hypothetical protein